MDEIKEYWRETFERWWNYRGLWSESLDDQPSAASVYSGLLIAFICLFVLSIFVNPYPSLYVNGIFQPVPMFIIPSIEYWLPMTLRFIITLIVYGLLWHWGETRNNRYIISLLMYLMILLIGILVAEIVGNSYKSFKPLGLDDEAHEAYSRWRDLYLYLMFPTLLVSPILVMWIQGWRHALIFSPILVFPCFLIMALAAGLAK